MKQDNRKFFIFSKHKRLTRFLRFFFTGWGLFMLAALVFGALFSKQILWTPIQAINMTDIMNNQFKMTNATFSGIDKDKNPFKIHAVSSRQEYKYPDIIFLEKVNGRITHYRENKKVTDNVSANGGLFNRKTKQITLRGNVYINSTNGDKMLTDELVIEL
ncbi:MAG: LPS export ABC transporter periplasmic protein LptC [Alphaproteobacteria bacterium]|nr:LPS export ABC transporter periplasmic protein LptC [Alphaproteobacteria bacterium]